MIARRASVAMCAALLLGGCDNMKNQESARPQAPSSHLARGTSAQLPPVGTVPHVEDRPPAVVLTGEASGGLVPEIPLRVTAELVERGRERFNIYCAVCHGADGYGEGIVVQRGFPRPPSFHDARLRNAPAGHFFAVITHGFGAMYPYADRLSVSDRWSVVAYIRALQLSQHADLRDLAAADRSHFSAP